MVYILPFLAGCGSNVDATSGTALNEPSAPALEAQLQHYDQQAKRFGGSVAVTLDLAHSSITDADLAALPLPEHVRSLDLSFTKVTDQGLATLSRARHLRDLSLVNVPITDAGVEHIRALPELESVNLKHTQVSNTSQWALMKELRQRAYDRQQKK
ncbi:MAG: hypothetical protein K8T91_27085 [Planctomycetes bacterium]|nr:hypothetical protein [Planctomycetota bacterium]